MLLYLDVFVPPFGLLLLGAALKRWLLPQDAIWAGIERLVFWALMPALLVSAIASVDILALPIGRMGLAIWLSLLTGGALSLALAFAFRADHPATTSVFQGGIRFNNYVGVTMAAGLFGAKGVALAAVANAAIVPTVNVLCVLVFARFGTARPSLGGILRQLATNPLIVACAVGIALQVTGLGLPPGLEGAMRALGQASLPLGLLCVGAALDFSAARAWAGPIVASSLVKFGLMPLVTYAACRALGLEGTAAVIALLFHALPTASSSYILARQLGGDAPLMAGITAAQTVLAGAVIPLVLALAPRLIAF